MTKEKGMATTLVDKTLVKTEIHLGKSIPLAPLLEMILHESLPTPVKDATESQFDAAPEFSEFRQFTKKSLGSISRKMGTTVAGCQCICVALDGKATMPR